VTPDAFAAAVREELSAVEAMLVENLANARCPTVFKGVGS
jgi:hypothetical protein